jgi:hypothetical protein
MRESKQNQTLSKFATNKQEEKKNRGKERENVKF